MSNEINELINRHQNIKAEIDTLNREKATVENAIKKYVIEDGYLELIKIDYDRVARAYQDFI